MAVIYVPGAITGTQYPIQISGATPTPTEQARIDRYIAEQESAAQADYQQLYGTPTVQAPPEPEDTTAFGRGVESGLASLVRAYGSTLEGIGGATGLGGLEQYGADIAAEKSAEMQRLAEASAAEKERENLGMIGRGATYVGEIAGQSAPQTATSLLGSIAGGAAAGFAAGSFTGPGALIGAGIGGVLAALPYFYGDFREQQKEADVAAGRPVQVNEQAALFAAIPASALDAILGAVGAKVGANVLTQAAAKGGLFTRAVRGGAEGALIEVPTELGQEVLGRYQAGEDLLSDDAIEAYKQAAIGAAVLGGGIGAVGGATVTGKTQEEERKKKELDEDLKDLAAKGEEYIANAEQEQEDLGTRAIAGPEAVPALPAPMTARTTPQEETVLTGRASMEAITPTRPVRLVDLPLNERVAISNARRAAGREPSPTVTLEELQAVVGTAASDREAKKQKPVTGGVERFAPVENKSFTQEQYERAVQQVKADKGVSVPKIRKAIAAITKAKVPNSVVADLRDEMVRRGVIIANPKARTGYSIAPIAQTDTAESGIRREIDGLRKQVDQAIKDRTRLVEDVRRVEQTGRDLSGKRTTVAEANQRLDTLDASIEAAKARIAASEARIRSAAKEAAIPQMERVAGDTGKLAVPMSQATPEAAARKIDALRTSATNTQRQLAEAGKKLEAMNRKARKGPLTNAEQATRAKLAERVGYLSDALRRTAEQITTPELMIGTAQEREAAAEARAAAAMAAEPAPLTPEYTAQQKRVMAALRKRLDNLGLKDVQLEGEQMMAARDAAGNVTSVTEGTFDPMKKLLALSMAIHGKGLTDQQLFDRLASVMNHEVIHALRLMGVLTDAEWKVLSNFARQKKYVAIKQGKPVTRSYTYEERAKAMGYANDVVEEEAVAEVFRDYLDGKIDVKGKPKGFFEKIKNFFLSLIGAHTDAGFDTVDKIFDDIRFGRIGARQRAEAEMRTGTAESAVPVVDRAKQVAKFSAWFGDSKAVDANGDPQVYYTGTSKDKDFTSFNVGRHGGWFTTDPDVASQYAVENDSMTFRREGWEYVKSNTASRVIPAFLRITNPYRGPMPESVFAENYKKSQSDWFDSLRAKGYDGWMPDDQPGLAVVLQEPQQVKSVFAKEFSPSKKDMRASSVPTNIQGEYNAKSREQQDHLVRAYNEPGVRPVGAAQAETAEGGAAGEDAAAAAWRTFHEPVTEAELRSLDTMSEDDFANFFRRPGWVVVTGTRENIDPRWKEQRNIENNKRLEAYLASLNLPYAKLTGTYKGEDQGVSFLVLADEDQGVRLGQWAQQESVLTRDGLVYSAFIAPPTSSTGEVLTGETAVAQDFFSSTERGRPFSTGLDFSTGPGNAVIQPGYRVIEGRPQLPVRESDGLVELFHWSDAPREVIDPAFAGTGPYQSRERRAGQKVSFFGINPRSSLRSQGTGYVKESALGNYRHMALVDPQRLYPYHTDPDKIKETVTGQTMAIIEQNYERAIRDAGYLGYYTEVMAGDPGMTPLGNVAKVYEALPVTVVGAEEGARSSRVPISPRLRAMTVIGRTNENGEFRDVAPRNAKGRIQWIKKEDAMRLLHEARGGFTFDLSNPESVDQIATMMAAEAERALAGDKSAIGWYDRHVRMAKQLLEMLHPELATDQAASDAMDFATAVTSNGLAVKDNYIFANKQFNHWKETGYFLEEGSGKQGASMIGAFRMYNTLKQPVAEGGLGMTDVQIAEFLSQRTTVGELRSNPVIQQLGIAIDAKEKVDTPVNVSYIIGPKIGQGFYQNLRGNFDELTMDRWWMRFFNRISGNSFKTYADNTINNGIERLRGQLMRNSMTDMEMDIVRRAMDNLDVVSLTDESVGQLAVEIDKLFQRAYSKTTKDTRPEKTELFLAASALRPKIEGELEESPRNATDRAFMRETTRKAIDALTLATGEPITMADFQALMWYWEKRLWRSMGIRSGRGEDNDYVDGAIELLRKEGIPDERIAEALPDSERRRLDSQPDPEGADGSVSEVSGGPDKPEDAVATAEAAEYAADVKAKRDKPVSPRQSTVPVRNSVAGVAQRQVAQRQSGLVYSRAADLLAKGLRIPGLGVDEAKSKQIADGIIKKFQDGMIPVGRMIDELRANGLNITDAMDTYMQEELYHGVVGDKIRSAQDNLYRPLIDMLKEVNVADGDIEAIKAVSPFARLAFTDTRSNPLSLADIYLYARHAEERNAYIREIDPSNDAGSGMTDREANDILNWFAGSRYAGVMRRIEGAAQDIVKSTNDVRMEAGLIPREFIEATDPETGEIIPVPQYDFYVPLRGKRDPESGELIDNDITGPYRSPMYGARRREDRRALGRYDYADNIISNLMVQNQNAVIRAERNKVGQSFLRLLRSNPALTRGYGRILEAGDLEPVMIRGTRDVRRPDGTMGKRVVRRLDPQFRQDPTIFVVKENGKEVVVKLENTAIASALKGAMSPTHSSKLLSTLQTINRYLASINTSYNPAFFVTNMARDLQTAGVNLGQYEINGLTSKVMKNMPGALKGIKQSIRNKDNSSEWAQVYRDFVRNGGQNAVNQVNTVADQMANINSIIGEIAQNGALGKYQMVKNSFAGKGARSLLSFIEDYNTVIENGVRVATYKALVDGGMSPQRAAQAARNVTVNFAKGGDYKTMMNGMYLFYNASLQGSFAMLNAALRSKNVQKLWVGVIGVGIMQDALNALLSEEDDDGRKQYDKIPAYVLEHNLILPDPFGFTGRSYISIPLPYGLNMAHNFGRALGRAARGEYTPAEAASTIVGTVANVINPIGGTESFANFAAPTVLDPFIDVWQNENFANAPVYKEGFPGDLTPLSQLYWSTTSVPAVWLAKNLNSLTGGTTEVKGLVDVSPDLIDFWFEYLTGGAGRFVIRSAEAPFRAYDEGFSEDVIRNLPIVGKVIGTVTSREDLGQYIEKRNSVLTALNELKAAAQENDAQRIAAARSRFPAELRIAGAISAIENTRRKLARQMGEIRDSKLPEDRKRVALDALDKKMQQLVARGNQLMRDL